MIVLNAGAFAAHGGAQPAHVAHWLSIAAMSRRGGQQSVNEDVYLLDPRAALLGAPAASVPVAAAAAGRYNVIAVANDIGAQPTARRAAVRAIETVAVLATAGARPRTIADVIARMHASVQAAHAVVRHEGQAGPERRNMAAALTAAAFLVGALLIAHVGHGRAYLYRRGALVRLTDDDTLSPLPPGAVPMSEGAPASADKPLITCVRGTLMPTCRSRSAQSCRATWCYSQPMGSPRRERRGDSALPRRRDMSARDMRGARGCGPRGR